MGPIASRGGLDVSNCFLGGGGGRSSSESTYVIYTNFSLVIQMQVVECILICLQLVKYQPGGHYHAHLDSTNDNLAENKGLPCCFQTNCGDKVYTPEWAKCCRLCRYVLEHFSHPYCINY